MIDERKQHFIDKYLELFSGEPKSILSCGGRFEILGNHTDHNHGLCLASACNLEIIAPVDKNNTDIVRFQSAGFEMDEVDLSDLEPRVVERGSSKGLIKGVAAYLKKLGYKIGGFNAYSESSIFKGAGVSSSAAFELLVGQIFNVLFNNGKISKLELCKAGKFAENNFFGKSSGLLDQIGVGFGGVVEIDFRNIEDPTINQYQFPFEDLHFVLINTVGDHSSLSDLYSSIPSDMLHAARICGHNYLIEGSLEEIEKHKSELTDDEYMRSIHFYKENERVKTAIEALKSKDQNTFLKMINESRESSTKYLKNMMVEDNYKGSPLEACDLFMKASDNEGAVKINGGGFAGSVIALIPTNKLEKVLDKMRDVYGQFNVQEIFIRDSGPNIIYNK